MTEISETLYGEIRRLAADRLRDDRARHSISATDLTHDAVERLLRAPGAASVPRAELLGRFSNCIRQVLVDRARRRLSLKRGEGQAPAQLDLGYAAPSEDGLADVLAVDEALVWLAGLDARQAQVVELRFFGGFTELEIGEALGCSERTVRSDWRKARAALRVRIEDSSGG